MALLLAMCNVSIDASCFIQQYVKLTKYQKWQTIVISKPKVAKLEILALFVSFSK